MWPFKRKEPRAETAAEMVAFSISHPATRDDWKERGGYPAKYENKKLECAVTYCHIWGRAGADFPLSDSDEDVLTRAVRGLRKYLDKKKHEAAICDMADKFERAYGTDEVAKR